MKRILTSMILLLMILSACSTDNNEDNNKMDTNYYLSLTDESDHWQLQGYEIMFTSDGYKAGNGMLEMKNADESNGDFLSFDVYGVVDGEENKIHSGSVSGETPLADMSTGTIEGEEKSLKEFPELDEIYMTVTWNEEDTDGDQEEKIILYNKDKRGETFLESS